MPVIPFPDVQRFYSLITALSLTERSEDLLSNADMVIMNGTRNAASTWVVAQVNDVTLHAPVLGHVDSINEGTSALRAEVVQAQVGDSGPISQANQGLHDTPCQSRCRLDRMHRVPDAHQMDEQVLAIWLD
jgi:hypothetical protein